MMSPHLCLHATCLARRLTPAALSLAFMLLNNECAVDDRVHLWGACATFGDDLHGLNLGKPA